jgi:uncharacterized protein YgfB (UPF0149 family)
MNTTLLIEMAKIAGSNSIDFTTHARLPHVVAAGRATDDAYEASHSANTSEGHGYARVAHQKAAELNQAAAKKIKDPSFKKYHVDVATEHLKKVKEHDTWEKRLNPSRPA